MQKHLLRLLALLAVFGLFAAACGSDDDDGDGGSTTTVAADDGGDEAADGGDEAADEMTDDEAADGGEATGSNVNEIDPALRVYQQAALPDPGDVPEAAPTCTGESDGVLSIGGLLPETGNLAFLGPPEFAGAELAVQDINAAGGVLGADIEWFPGDSSDNGDVANQTVDRHLAEGVDAVVGAASSGVSFTVIDKLVEACKIHFSPANTSPDFTEYEEDDLYFRTAPSDVLQGQVLADLIVAEGSTTVGLMALQDPYGEGLLNFTKLPLEEQGAEVVLDFVYDPTAPNFDAEVEQMVSADPEAIVVIGFDETAQILTGLFENGFTPDVKKIYLVDGNVGNAMGANFPDEGALTGIKGTLPTAEVSEDFQASLLEVDPELVDFTYGPETYDAIVIMALAAAQAGSDDPAQIAANIIGVTRGGEKCSTFEECAALIEAGTDIDYDGPSGPQEFGPAGEPTAANFAIDSYNGDVDPSS
ncbi:MAG: ABC transporter substrate-binding protein [Acidimicrobiia bacterium]|nr:ABC transporter substrate-binding protein [Acidimicrobiia bacterium]